MTKTLPRLFTSLLLLAFSACGPGPAPIACKGYLVDKSVEQKVNSKIGAFHRKAQSFMDFKIYENDSLTWDSQETKKIRDQCMTMTTLEGDTINIVVFLGMAAGFGYQIALFRDTCMVVHFAKSDAEIYKLRENDSLEFGVNVPCKHYTLTLSERPNFKKGQVLNGVVDLDSENYFEVANGTEKRCRVQLTGYFRTDPVESLYIGE
jgi:hypothetical protein